MSTGARIRPMPSSAASRALTAAQRAGDLLLAATSAYLLTRILLEAGRDAQAEETAG